MSNVEKLSIALTADLAAAVRQAVDSGAYATSSEVIREALRDWDAKRTREAAALQILRQQIAQGIASGPGIDGRAVFDRLEAKYSRMVSKADADA
jgi:antitoxin ParD1/3/4